MFSIVITTALSGSEDMVSPRNVLGESKHFKFGHFEDVGISLLYSQMPLKTPFIVTTNNNGTHYCMVGYKLSDLYGAYLLLCYYSPFIVYYNMYNGNWHRRDVLT